MVVYTIKNKCRSCQSSNFEEVLSLGKQCISAFVDTKTESIKAPLNLNLCQNCNLLQLKYTTNPDILYSDNYSYRSGINQSMKDELSKLVASTMAQKRLEEGDIVVDIGSSDGTLLSYYPENIVKVGFEPIHKFQSYYEGHRKVFFNEFFNAKSFHKYFLDKKAKIITAIAMFYDLDDPNRFLKDITL